MSGRCVACNAIFKPEEIIWYEDRKCFESHCNRCRTVAGVKEALKKDDENEEDESNDVDGSDGEIPNVGESTPPWD